jgi:UDP-3-O-[3-hydroxymyristoyl] N-acetylglucosamine deacetylase
LSPFPQFTLARSVVVEGVGIHTGHAVRLTLRPAAAESGIRFLRIDVKDRDPAIAARAEAVVGVRLGTVIGNADGVSVSTVEHLMAAFSGLGVDNALVEIDGPEVPIMDGSGFAFVEAIDKAGRRAQAARRRHIEILEPVRVIDGDSSAALVPAETFELAVEIDFETVARASRWSSTSAVFATAWRPTAPSASCMRSNPCAPPAWPGAATSATSWSLTESR